MDIGEGAVLLHPEYVQYDDFCCCDARWVLVIDGLTIYFNCCYSHAVKN